MSTIVSRSLCALISCAFVAPAVAQVNGAVYTTNKNGSQVNGNVYNKKRDVYLTGGPGAGRRTASAEARGPRAVAGVGAEAVRRVGGQPVVRFSDGSEQAFDQVVLACHSDQALRIIADCGHLSLIPHLPDGARVFPGDLVAEVAADAVEAVRQTPRQQDALGRVEAGVFVGVEVGVELRVGVQRQRVGRALDDLDDVRVVEVDALKAPLAQTPKQEPLPTMSNDAPALLSLEEAEARLLAPGSPFELTEEAADRLQRFLRDNPKTPLTVAFTDASTGDVDSWLWDFGDGNTGSGPTPSHAYAAGGTYNVALTVTDDDGTSATDFSTAAIDSPNEPPVADANGPYVGVVDAPVSFDGTGSSDPDGSIAYMVWSFGDDGHGSGEAPSHTYAEAGVYDVILAAFDNDGGVDPVITKAYIVPGNLPPLQRFEISGHGGIHSPGKLGAVGDQDRLRCRKCGPT